MSGLQKEIEDPEIDNYVSDNDDDSVDYNASDANSVVSSDDEDIGAGKDDDSDIDEDAPTIYTENVGDVPGIPHMQGETSLKYNSGDESDDDDNEDEQYLQKFDEEMNKNFLVNFHPECVNENDEEIHALWPCTTWQSWEGRRTGTYSVLSIFLLSLFVMSVSVSLLSIYCILWHHTT